MEHLPELKKEELKVISDLIVEKMLPDFVILFGSYARGNWVEDRYSEDGITYEYKSDYDILVLTETKLNQELSDKWRETERLVKEMSTSASVNLIHHSYGYVKNELSYGSYFFTDVVKEGVLLYDNGRNGPTPLVLPASIDPEKVKQRAKEEYDRWFESSNNFIDGFTFYFSTGKYNEAAFLLHQATERYYTALLLVFTGYKAKIHDIEELGSQAETINEEFKKVFPRDTPEKDERLKLLKKAYIDSRYKKNYSIGKEDLEYLNERVAVLRELVEKVCGERLDG
ncbi:HEPN domain-containing protein [Sporocytophaga myxococcoides]|uniref:HEPN domain-containing protein n=1 Tax=Sporocytophaga myxococcoides TaxID=153721 RepID=A0A098LL33_9BACT|nr:HEPN domain-containing protein [Sporocytophaga myxococcoides]